MDIAAVLHGIQQKKINTRTIAKFFSPNSILTLGVLTVRVKGRFARSRRRTEVVAIYTLSWLDVQFRGNS